MICRNDDITTKRVVTTSINTVWYRVIVAISHSLGRTLPKQTKSNMWLIEPQQGPDLQKKS